MGGGVVVSGVLVCLHLRCMVFFFIFFWIHSLSLLVDDLVYTLEMELQFARIKYFNYTSNVTFAPIVLSHVIPYFVLTLFLYPLKENPRLWILRARSSPLQLVI